MSEKRFIIKNSNTVSSNYPSERVYDNKVKRDLYNSEIVIMLNKLWEENEQLRMKLKGDDYIMVSEMLSNLRKTGICDGCKNKDKPVEWYLERGFSITGRVCDRYEPE